MLGLCFYVIKWEAKKQKSVALSTMEAEYIALSEVAKESIYMRRLLKHMGHDDLVSGATIVHCDNQSAIQLSKNCVFHGKSKQSQLDIISHAKQAKEAK